MNCILDQQGNHCQSTTKDQLKFTSKHPFRISYFGSDESIIE